MPGATRGANVLMTYEKIMRMIHPDRNAQPTAEQRLVIEAEDPALLVVAGAGSGKTATMADRIAYQVAIGRVDPGEVLGLTFTRKAAGELAQRVESTLGRLNRVVQPRESLTRPLITTYNSFAVDIASSYGLLIGVDPAARLVTDGERWQLMSQIIEEWPNGVNDFGELERSSLVESALALEAAILDNQLTTDAVREFLDSEITAIDVLAQEKRRFGKEQGADSKVWSELKAKAPASLRVRRELLDVVEAYFQRKRDEGLVEFADQVASASAVLNRHPDIGREVASQYRLVLLDEYQDTSVNQAAFITAALTRGEDTRAGSWRSVCAVGDPNQAIYGWRGASANALADFAARLPDVRQLSLSVSFRSDDAILDAANAVAANITTGGVEVRKLRSRPHAGPGRVIEIRPWLREESYLAIGLRIRDVIAELRRTRPDHRPEIAVLGRKRIYLERMAPVLQSLGIPYEFIGGESMIRRPEILTLRAALGVVASPGRNDLLLRLLTLYGIGADDLRALDGWSRELAKRQVQGTRLDRREERSLIEAVTYPPQGEESSLSETARQRIAALSEALAELRRALHSPLTDLIARAVRLLGLDVTAVARRSAAQRVRTSIDSFIALGSSYTADHPDSSVADFLEWLDAVDLREHGGEEEAGQEALPTEDVEVHPGVVQLMTIHAAKGLQWEDLVAVPELVDGQFSEITKGVHAWPQSNAVFPYPLRADYRYLPRFQVAGCADKFEAGADYRVFKSELLPAHESQEMRRLAYVAFTRPRAELLLAGFAADTPEWIGGLKKSEKQDEPIPLRQRSSFLSDIRAATDVPLAPVASVAAQDWPANLLVEAPEVTDIAELMEVFGAEVVVPPMLAPVPTFEDDLCWPKNISRSLGERLRIEPTDDRVQAWYRQAEILLAEQRQAGAMGRERPYLTATDVVRLQQDPEQFRREQRRPIPRQPSHAARTGTTLHARIASHFSAVATLDIDLPEETEEPALPREREHELLRVFESTPWAALEPIAVEQPLEVVVAGRVIRCTIDAVFETAGIPGRAKVTVVDWKSGRRPGPEQLAARELQLALYRLAWSRAHALPLEDVGACFVYLGSGGHTFEAGMMSEEEIAKRIEDSLLSNESSA
ncbi:MAG: ATP-dependent helicase [Actinomycetaceae bacterium]|nr:ATP-dependent helicase [Actinomycetaceae bacterium]